MTKQLVKGFTMLMMVVALALVTAVASAKAQGRTRASVPFDFIVGDKTLPAGDYNVTAINAAGDALRISSRDAKASAARLTMPLSGSSEKAKLVFHRYGQSYFLAEVWPGSGSEGRRLTKAKQERAMEKEMSKIASVHGSTQPAYETVEIFATLH